MRDEALEQQQARAALCRDDPVSPAALSELQDRGMGEGALGDLRSGDGARRLPLRNPSPE